MLVKVFTSTYFGIKGFIVTIESDIANGLPNFEIVGLADTTIKEAKERVRYAIKNSGFEFPNGRILINLAPADIKKEGAYYDLPIALAILKSSQQIQFDATDTAIIGELSLDGQVRRVNGALLMTIAALESKFKRIIVPYDNRGECAVVKGIDVYPVKTLHEAIKLIQENESSQPFKVDVEYFFLNNKNYDVDFSEVKGQEYVKRAIEIAVAGFHNLLMIGPPGVGKTMIAKRIPTILPPMSFEESLEVTKIYSSAGLLNNDFLITKRPFRAPHHTSSYTSIVGGGKIPKPGEISLAHNGVLFLDELPEFDRKAIEVLRQPMEDGEITISRAQASIVYPANFMLVASMNPCPCGYYLSEERECICSATQIRNYLGKISKPIQDRIDIHIEVKQVKDIVKHENAYAKSSDEMRKCIKEARKIQMERFKNAKINFNSQMKSSMINKYCNIDFQERLWLENALNKLNLSIRAYFKVIKVARTIADLDLSEKITREHLSEAICYRLLDRKLL